MRLRVAEAGHQSPILGMADGDRAFSYRHREEGADYGEE